MPTPHRGDDYRGRDRGEDGDDSTDARIWRLQERVKILEITVGWWTKGITALLGLVAAAMVALAFEIGLHVIQNSASDFSGPPRAMVPHTDR